MKSLAGYRCKGFTILEIMIVVGILTVLTVSFASFGVSFYNLRNLDVQEQNFVQTLRRAQLKAMSGDSDSSFGVYVTPNNYTLFKGGSYVSRNKSFDEVFVWPNNFSVSGLSEIVFNKLSGTTTNVGNIVLTIGNHSESVNINETGRINY